VIATRHLMMPHADESAAAGLRVYVESHLSDVIVLARAALSAINGGFLRSTLGSSTGQRAEAKVPSQQPSAINLLSLRVRSAAAAGTARKHALFLPLDSPPANPPVLTL